MANLARVRLEIEEDRKKLEHAWKKMGMYRKDREKIREQAKKAEAEVAPQAEELKKIKTDTTEQVKCLIEELASNERKCSELRRQVVKANNQAALVVEKYKSLA